MPKLSKLLLIVASLCVLVSFTMAQAKSTPKKSKRKNEKTQTDKSAGQSDSLDIKKLNRKDPQNQVIFMKPDIESKEYNFFDRKAISVPLMPRVDLDSAVYQNSKRQKKQQQAFLNNKYLYPARPKDQWELGINFGYAFVRGDVQPDWRTFWQNWGAGLTVRKAIGHTFSLRFQYDFNWMKGLNWEPDFNLRFNQALNGTYNNAVNYVTGVGASPSDTIPRANRGYFFYNYRTFAHNVALQGVVNLGNIRFYKERNMVNFYAFFGAGGSLTRTWMDALDENGKMYDFTDVLALYQLGGAAGAPPVNERRQRRREALRLLRDKFDGKFESAADREVNIPGLFKNYQFLPTINFGFGVGFHISKWVTLSLEQKLTTTNNDVLDGYRWTQDEYPGFTRDFDIISYTSIGFNFHLGKNRLEPLWWLNPNDYVYRKLAETNPDKIIAEAFKDDDGDGVPNRLDKEPNTKKDCPVDVKGVSLDSDKDGIIDCEDKEPYSPPGYPVDQYGVAQIPPNPCCDEEALGGAGGVGPEGTKRRRGRGTDCSRIELPGVYFDNDKYYIDPMYLSTLHQIAERMQQCPDMRLVITGYDESKNDPKYNEQLAWNRAQKVADYLVEKYGISRDRFIIKYIGGKKSDAGKSEFERKQNRRVEFRYAEDDEKGESNPPAPHPGYKAGSDK
ncbi:MAG: OmpA family protein [Chitinophagales bacterium]|nr:OmpA family protein [Chitinophagales bacterium]MDW8273819.1 OmpA family protein [Chitinophagales bacterium]